MTKQMEIPLLVDSLVEDVVIINYITSKFDNFYFRGAGACCVISSILRITLS